MKRMGMQYPKMDQFDDPGQNGSGIGDDPNNPSGDNPGSEGTPPTNSEGQQTGISFTHPDLQGLTEEQIVEARRVAKATFLEQSRQLNELRNQLNSNPPAPMANQPGNNGGQGGIPDDDPYASFDSTRFFENPGAGFKTVEDRVVAKLSSHLEQMIKPFAANLHEGRRSSVWNELFQAYPDARQYEDFIKTVSVNIPDDKFNYSALEYLYFAAKGRAAAGVSMDNTPNGNPPANNAPATPNAPPQHRPSSHPVNNAPAKPKVQLTEEDRTFMRAYGMTEDEYAAYQNADESDVLTMKIPGANNG